MVQMYWPSHQADNKFSPEVIIIYYLINKYLGPSGYIQVWNVINLNCEMNIDTGHRNRIWSISFSKNGNRFATASSDITVKVWSSVKFIFTFNYWNFSF